MTPGSLAHIAPPSPGRGPLPTREAQEADQARLTAIQACVDRLVAILTGAGIPYCILRNRDMIPAGLVGWKDIDILVPGDLSVRDLAALLAPLAPANIGPMRRGHTSFYLPASDIFIRVDVYHGDLRWKQAPFANHRAVLARRQEDRGYMVAAPIDQASIVWISKLLTDGRLPDSYHQLVTDAVRQAPDVIRGMIATVLGERLADDLVALAVAGRVADSAQLADACRRALWVRALRRRPLASSWAFIRQIGHGLAQRAHPSGLDVTLLGPDGSGKTLVCTRIADSPLRTVPYKKIRIQKGYRQHLPELRKIAGALVRRPIAPVGDARDPHGAPPHHPLVWLLKFVYYTVDTWLQHVQTRRDLAHTGLVIRDRYLIELTIDARRYRYVGPSFIPHLIATIQPRPTMVIVLDAPPDVLQTRKHEVPLEESIRQRQAYRELALRHANGHIVRSDRPIDDVVRDVLDLLIAHAKVRTRTRYGVTMTGGGAP